MDCFKRVSVCRINLLHIYSMKPPNILLSVLMEGVIP